MKQVKNDHSYSNYTEINLLNTNIIDAKISILQMLSEY